MIVLHFDHEISLFIIWKAHWTLEKNKTRRKSIDEQNKSIWRDPIAPRCTILWAGWGLISTNIASFIFFNFIFQRCKWLKEIWLWFASIISKKQFTDFVTVTSTLIIIGFRHFYRHFSLIVHFCFANGFPFRTLLRHASE